MRRRSLSNFIFRIGLVVIIVFLAKTYFFQPVFMLDSGMEPTFKENRIYFINKFVYHFKEPERGEVIFFRTSDDPPLFFIARVVGLPEETLEIKNGVVFINGKALREDYTQPNLNWNLDKLKIKENSFYILSDNRKMSLKSHLHSQVIRKNILGKVMEK